MLLHAKIALIATVFAALSTPCVEARADDSGGAAASLALFTEGRRLMAAGDYAGACPKFAESKRLARGIGIMLNLALCYEGLGRTASAWSEYLEAAAAAHEKGQTEREAGARARAARLEPGLLRATLAVAPQAGAQAIEVKVDGKPLPSELWGVATPMDPGRHEVNAVAPGRESWVSTIDVQAGHSSALEVPVLVPITASPTPEARPWAPQRPPPREPHRLPNESPMKTLGIVLGAAGAATFGLGIAFALAANTENDNSKEWCRPAGCLPRGQSDLSRARTEADIASVAVPLGLAALVGGMLVWLEAPRTALARTGRFGIVPSVSQSRWSVTATEAF